MITKEGIDVPVMDITADNYACRKGSEHLFHVKLEVKQFDPKTGKRLSHPFIQKFSAKNFRNSMLPRLRKLGYDVEILFNPEEYKKQTKAEAEAKAEAKKAEEAKRAEDAIREKLMAELREQGMLKEATQKKQTKKAKEEAPAEPEAPVEPEDIL